MFLKSHEHVYVSKEKIEFFASVWIGIQFILLIPTELLRFVLVPFIANLATTFLFLFTEIIDFILSIVIIVPMALIGRVSKFDEIEEQTPND